MHINRGSSISLCRLPVPDCHRNWAILLPSRKEVGTPGPPTSCCSPCCHMGALLNKVHALLAFATCLQCSRGPQAEHLNPSFLSNCSPSPSNGLQRCEGLQRGPPAPLALASPLAIKLCPEPSDQPGPLLHGESLRAGRKGHLLLGELRQRSPSSVTGDQYC